MDLSRLRAIFVLAGISPTAGCADLEGNQPTNTSASVGDPSTIGDADDTGSGTEMSSTGGGGTSSNTSDAQDPSGNSSSIPTSGPANESESTTGEASESATSSTTMPGGTAPGSSTGYGTVGYDTTGYYNQLPGGAAPDDAHWFSQTLDCGPLDAHCRPGSTRPHNP